MDLWQSGFNPLKPGVTKIAICGFLLGVINFNVAAVPARPFPSYPDASAVLDDFMNFSKALVEPYRYKNVCRSQGCVEAAREIRRNMDDRVEPCTDFFNFICGRFPESRTIPEGADHQDVFSIIQDDVNANLISMLESEDEPDESKSFQLAKKLYRSCTSTTEDREIEHVKEILKKLGGWPVLEGDSWDDTRFNWKRWNYEARKYGDSGQCFFGFKSSLSADKTKTLITLTQPEFTTEKEFLVSSSNLEHYTGDDLNSFLTIARMFGVNTERALTELRESLLLEVDLAKLTVSAAGGSFSVAPYESRFHIVKRGFPNVTWDEYFSNLLPPNTSIAEDEYVIIENLLFWDQLEKLMSNTSKRVQANYALWRVIWDKRNYINGKIRNLYLDHNAPEKSKRESLSKLCLDDITSSFSYSVDSRYVQKYFTQEMKKNVTEILESIRQQLIIRLEQTEWLDEEMKEIALEKAAAIKGQIGYDDVLLNDSIIDEHYRGMRFTEDNYLGNKFNQASVNFAAEYNELRVNSKKIAPSKLDRLTRMNAEFIPPLTIIVTASFLRGIIYNIERPVYMNYGTAGWLLGHEFIHGFDEEKIGYDKHGIPTNWWRTSSRKVFNKLTICFIQQYTSYTNEGQWYGTRTLDENIADNGGIKLAYRAYENWAQKNGEEPRLPGLENYSPRQMFWITAANIYCFKGTEKFLNERTASDRHALPKYRVIGSMSNSPEFAADFECSGKLNLPSPSLMIPEKRCGIW